jgi:hypothetical protein
LAFSPNLAPFSVFPFPDRMCVDLLLGAKAYRVLLDISAVEQEFQRRGWEIVKSAEQSVRAGEFAEIFLTVSRDGFYCNLAPASLMRLQMELLRPQVLIQQCELIKRAGPEACESAFHLPVYKREATIWD